MLCRKCKKQIDDDSVFCKYCGVRQEIKRSRRQRPNGAGTAVPRGKSWTAVYNVTYVVDDGRHDQDKITLGGFSTKRAALEFIPVLKSSAKIPKDERNKALRLA